MTKEQVKLSPQVWWVNQGQSYERGSRGGYLWAPTQGADGRTRSHWEAMQKLRPGHLVIHYANGHIRSVGVVTEPSVLAPRQDPAADARWHDVGYLVRVDYGTSLTPPLPLGAIPNRPRDVGPFDRSGGVKQGYLFPIEFQYARDLMSFLGEQGATPPVLAAETGEDLRQALELIDSRGSTEDRVVQAERMHTAGVTYTAAEREVVLNRAESLLVAAYKDSLPARAMVTGLRCASGVIDIFVNDAEDVGSDLIEAKSASTHAKVREALGQILDYAHNTTTVLDRVTALFPRRPHERDVALLHRYGIDVLHANDEGGFTRVASPEQNRSLWQSEPSRISAGVARAPTGRDESERRPEHRQHGTVQPPRRGRSR